jgi:DNA-binding beta-propeller fold protein YncE
MLAFALALFAGLLATALAATGDLAYQGCFATRHAYGCEQPAHNSLGHASDVAVSRDGESVYVASANGITRFKRSPDGALTYKNCFANEGAHGCKDPPHDSLGEASGVAVSADSKSVYVTSSEHINYRTGHRRGGNSITRFKRGPSGVLTYKNCFANGGVHGCKDPRHHSLGDASDVAVSRDGKSVYVASSGHSDFPSRRQAGGNSITRFKRSSNGALAYGGCIANRGAHRCRRPLHDSLYHAEGVAVSPEGKSVYVVSSGEITRFRRAANGRLAYADCIANQGNHGCGKPANDSLGHARDVAVSSDGTSVYVAGGNSITYFTRGADGALTYGGCIANRGQRGCEPALYDSLRYSAGVAVSRDGASVYGASVYVASGGGDSITDFERASNGALTYGTCIANQGAHGCEAPPHDSLGDASGVAVSPDGRSVYVAAGSGAITRFSRETPAP